MSSVSIIDAVAAPRQPDTQIADARARQAEATRPAVTFGGALSHLNEDRKSRRTDPAAAADKSRGEGKLRTYDERDAPPPANDNSAPPRSAQNFIAPVAEQAAEIVHSPDPLPPEAPPELPKDSIRAERFAQEQAAYAQRQIEKAGERLDIEV